MFKEYREKFKVRIIINAAEVRKMEHVVRNFATNEMTLIARWLFARDDRSIVTHHHYRSYRGLPLFSP